MKNLKKMWVAVAIAMLLPLLAACGGGNGGNGNETPAPGGAVYSVGGTVTGLNGTLLLQLNGGTPGSMSGDGQFIFPTKLANGAVYNVTVSSQPLRQTCTVSNGSGTIRSADVTNVQVACTNNSGGVTLSGKIAVPPGVIIDGSVNDPLEKYEPNETPASAQVIPNPITVGGYVNRPLRGALGRSFLRGNPLDYYQVQLKAGDVVTLAIGESDTSRNDLDLYLYDLYNGSLREVDYSEGVGTYEVVIAPSDGIYYIEVYAFSGASNYILTVGADIAAGAGAEDLSLILSSRNEIVPGQVIVRLKDTVKTFDSGQTFTQYASGMGLTLLAGSPGREMLMAIDDLKYQAYANNNDGAIKRIHEGSDEESWEQKTFADPEKMQRLNTLMAINELRKQAEVLSAEPNYVVRTYGKTPNDTHYEWQWNMPMISLPEAWDVTTGDDNIVVAVLDTGVLLQHPDLKNRLTTTGYSFVSGETGGTGSNPNDPGNGLNGVASTFHGTHVSGIIAAETDNALGVAGVTWKTKIMPVRVLGGSGSGSTYDIAQGILYAAGLTNDSGRIPSKPADIINMSLGGPNYSCPSHLQQAINAARAKGVILIAASGNENTASPSYPASCDGVISVSAVDRNGFKASYSNHGRYIDVAAPGGDSGGTGDVRQYRILSTDGDDSTGPVIYTYSYKAGTSMAAPHVAGVAALMKATHPALSPADFDNLLAAGQLTDDTGNGETNYYGRGLINAFKAVAAASKLAGGAAITGIDASPRNVNFGVAFTEMSVTVSEIGTGGLSVTGSTSADWLTVIPNSVNARGFGRYTIRVDRSVLHVGTYTDVVTFTASSGTSVSVRVNVQVRSDDDVIYDTGFHYVLLVRLYNDDDIDVVDQFDTAASGGYYRYEFINIPPGNYLIIAGSDRNNNGVLGDGGEAFGAYPTVEQMAEIKVESSNIKNLDFETNLRLSIFTSSMASEEPVEDMPGLFMRLRQPFAEESEKLSR